MTFLSFFQKQVTKSDKTHAERNQQTTTFHVRLIRFEPKIHIVEMDA